MSEPPQPSEAEENKPYRRLVSVVFGLAVILGTGIIFRGVVRVLDRLPSAATLERPAVVDTRALLACAEDLDKLEAKIRKAAAVAFGEPPQAQASWPAAHTTLELERITIVARCRLDEGSDDAAVHDLERAADSLEGMLRSYSLLLRRHGDDGWVRAQEVRAALDRAATALKSR